MRSFTGRIDEISFYAGRGTARIACPSSAIPTPGQYLVARPDLESTAFYLDNELPVLGVPLFPAELLAGSFLAAPPVPGTWGPGVALRLRGPCGKGFHLPTGVRRLALAALGDTVARLAPLARQILQADGAVTLYTDASLPSLSAAVEVYPTAALPEAPAWADFLALDLPLADLPFLRDRLGLSRSEFLACPAQALIDTSMPCAGLGECGACAVEGRRGWKLACEHGPVFRLDELNW